MRGPTDVSRKLRPLLAASAVSLSGDGAFAAAAPLLAASLDTSPIAVSMVAAGAFAPWLVAGLAVGAFVDRWDRRRTMIASDLIRAGVLAVLVALVATQSLTIPILIGIVFLRGVASCFFDAASQAMIPDLVGRDEQDLTRANTTLWSADTAGRQLAGPVIGSSAYAASVVLPFALDLLSFLWSAVVLRRLPPLSRAERSDRSPLADLHAGLTQLRQSPPLMGALGWTILFNLGYAAATGVLVLFVTVQMRLSAGVYGVLLAVAAVGALVGARLVSILAQRIPTPVIMSGTLAVAGCSWATIAAWPILPVAIPAMACVGAATMFGTVVLGTLRQMHTPSLLLGRVVAAFRMFGIGATAVGALIGGATASMAGTTRAAMLIAPVCAVVHLLVTRPWSSTRD